MIQWEFQNPELEVPYHIRPYLMGIFPYIGLKNRPKIYGIGTSNQSVPGQHGHSMIFMSGKPNRKPTM